MSIFRKKIDDISIDDVEQFITDKHPENIRLEYKSGFSSADTNQQIAKEVSAFANQQGGVLIYGIIEESGKTRKPDAVIGIDKSLTPRQKIQSVCLDHIYPPVVPEIQECELKSDTSKVVVVVRVDMSDEAPHTINQRTGFYIRVQDRSDPREMNEEEITMLLNRRAKIVEQRDRLLQRTYRRVFPPDVKRNFMLTPSILIVTPIYPMYPLIDRGRLYDVYNTSEVKGGQGFPLETDRIRTASDSIYAYISAKDEDKLTVRKERYGELNIFGQVSYYENAIHNFNSAEGVWLGYELRNLYLMIKFTANFYKNIGYWGIIKFILRMESCRGVKLLSPRDGYGFSDELGTMELDSELNIERDSSVMEITDKPEEFIESIFQEYLWNVGLSVHRANEMPVGYWLDKIKMDLYGSKPCPKCNKYKISNFDSLCRECRK
jgi:hypothetical protein